MSEEPGTGCHGSGVRTKSPPRTDALIDLDQASTPRPSSRMSVVKQPSPTPWHLTAILGAAHHSEIDDKYSHNWNDAVHTKLPLLGLRKENENQNIRVLLSFYGLSKWSVVVVLHSGQARPVVMPQPLARKACGKLVYSGESPSPQTGGIQQ